MTCRGGKILAKRFRRKTEAQRNLVRAEENLARLRDIMTELESRLAPLRSQSEKAKTFLMLSAEKKELEVSIWTDTIESSNRALKDQSDKLLVSNQRLTETDALLKGGATLFLTTLTLVRLPIMRSPSLICSARRTSRRILA